MGKNQYGGNKQKSMANKTTEAPMRYSTCDLELYARVTKALGNGMFHVEDNNKRTYMAHVRGKMRGKSKRSNLIKVGEMLLIGLREWETTSKNADVLYIYEENQTHLISENDPFKVDKLIERNDIISYDYGESEGVSTNNTHIHFDESNIDFDNI